MKWIRYFILYAGAVLLVSALSRFLIAFGTDQVLSLPESVLGIPLRYAVLLVGIFEFAVAWLCLFGKRIGFQAGCVTWLAVNYAVYRIGAITMGAHYQTLAIGSVTDPLQLAHGFVGMIAGLSPVCLLVGGSTSTVWFWLEKRTSNRREEDGKSIKMSCPGCGVHIRFESARIGQQIDCPQCRKSITLLRPENLKISCFFCHEHIEFLADAVGEKSNCPHCGKHITLKAHV